MKHHNKFLRLISILLATAIVLPTGIGVIIVSASEMADEWTKYGIPSEAPPEVEAEAWYQPTAFRGYERNGRYLTIKTVVNNRAAELYLSFPSMGGFRLENTVPPTEPQPVEKTAIFEPESNIQIDYKTIGNTLVMTGADGTLVNFKAKGSSWAMDIFSSDGKLIVTIDPSCIYFGFAGGEICRVKLELPLNSNEVIYGTGERYSGVNQNGKRSMMWNCDVCYHGSEIGADGIKDLWRGYKNIPILHSNRGYTLFYNSTCCAEVDIGYTDETKYTMDFCENRLDFYFWSGTMAENIQKYTDLTGKSYLPPKWAFQYQAGGSNGFWGVNDSDLSQYLKALKLINAYEKMETPLNTVYLEGANLLGTNNKVASLFKDKGVRMLKWNNADAMTIKKAQELMPERKSNLPILRFSGGSYCGTWIDYSDDNGIELLTRYLKQYTDIGIQGGMLDFAELVVKGAISPSTGLDGTRLHNFYTYGYAKGYYEAYNTLTNGDGFCYIRGASAGTQRWAALWAGDQYSTFAQLKMQLSAGLSAASCGFSIWGTDLAGLDGTPSDELYCRALMMAAFSPIMRTGGNISKLPTDYGTSVQNTYKKTYWLRENMLNKLYSAAIESHTSGLPMMQAMAIAFPENSELAAIEDQYLFCDDFLVNPVLEEGATSRDVSLPSGMWYDLWSGGKLEGGVTVNAAADVEKIPVYVKSGAVIPLTLNSQLALGEKITEGEETKCLLITPPESERTSVYNIDEENSVNYKSLPVDNSSFMIMSSQGNTANCLTVYGEKITGITVDGKRLSKLESKPSSADSEGFYVENDSKTLVYIGTSDWANITVCYENDYSEMTKASVGTPEKAYFGKVLSSLTESELSDYYEITEENGVTVYTRNSTKCATNAWSTKNNIAFLYGKEYKDFTLDFDYSFNSSKTGQQWLWVTLGNQSYTDSSASSGAAAIGIGINGYSDSATCKVSYNGNFTKTLDPGTFDTTGEHHLRITVDGNNIAILIDDQFVVNTALDVDYSGGFIGFGCNYEGTRISSVTLDGTNSAYFCNSMHSGSRIACDPEDYYTITENETGNSYIFKGENGSWVGNTVMLPLEKCKNFTLEFDYTHVGSGERYLWLNWGLDECSVYNPQNGAASLGIGARDNTLQTGFLNCIYSDTVYAWFDGSDVGWLDSNGTLNGTFDATAPHHVSLTVKNGYIIIDFDNGTLTKRRAWNDSYHGGYVMIGTNSTDTVIENISLTDYDSVGYSSVYGKENGVKAYNSSDEFYVAANDGNSVIRNNSYTSSTPFLVLGQGKEITLDFDLMFSSSDAISEQWVKVCYGLSNPTAYNASSGSGYIGIGISQYSVTENTTCYIMTCDGEKTELCSIDPTDVQKIRIIISGGRLFVRVGDTSTAVTLNNYTGGYILLGTDGDGIMLSNITLSQNSDEDTVYITDNSLEGAKTAVAAEALYNITQNGYSFERNNISPFTNLSDGITAYLPMGTAENFYLEFNCSFPVNPDNDQHYVWITLGAESVDAAVGGDGSQVIGIGNNLYAQLCKINQDNPWVFVGGYAQTEEHHVKLSVIDGVMNVKIDGGLKNRVDLKQGYNGGYVLLGLNSAHTVISDIYFESLDTADYEEFSAYFTLDLENTVPTSESIGSHWRYDSNTASLERTGIDFNNNNSTEKMAILYYNKKQYNDLDLMVDYRVTDQSGIYIGMGCELGYSWMGSERKGYAAYIKSDGTVSLVPQSAYLQGNSEEYGVTLSDCGTLFSSETDRLGWHTCKISLRSGTVSIYIDGKCQGSAELYGYDGGYVSVAAHSEFVRFKEFDVTDGYSALTLVELRKALLYGEERRIFDYNEDTFVNIVDLVRLKKLAVGVLNS